MSIILRPYQQDAVNAVYGHLQDAADNPCVVIPTGGGKTPVIATICRDAVQWWNGRVLVLSHVKELLEQTVDKLRRICPDIGIGVYSAGLRRKDLGYSVTVAGIQSIYKRACELDKIDLIIVDEAHMIPPDGEGMYRQFLADAKVVNPDVRMIGLTATPFRMKSGSIATTDGFLNTICYKIGVKELINQGFLSVVRSKAGTEKVDTESLHVRGGEFVASEVEAMMGEGRVVEGACQEIIRYTADRAACLIFTAGIDHGRQVVAMMKVYGIECGFLDANTAPLERAGILSRFQTGELKYLANVNILTTGFDAPHIDCIALLRPTMSPGLYYQMVGRGFRLHPGKNDCLVLDFAGNVERHGPVDQLDAWEVGPKKPGTAPVKECPNCHSHVAAAALTCPECGYLFPVEEKPKHVETATTAGVISGQETIEEYAVSAVTYRVHEKCGAPPGSPRTMRVDYQVSFWEWKSEWICVEHDGFAGQKAASWWNKRCKWPMPRNAEGAVVIAESGGLAPCASISVRSIDGEKFDRIISYGLGPIPSLEGVIVPVAEDGGYSGEDESDGEETSEAAEAILQLSPDDDIPF